MKGHIILVGLPGSGKSTVGAALAAAIGRAFLDFDEEIARRAGRTVAEIFAADGEAHFRAAERALTAELQGAEPMVLAPGGGWIATPGNLELLRPPGTVVYLAVSPLTALDRMGSEVVTRPLLAATERAEALEALLERRKPLYLQANHVVSTDLLAPDDVVRRIVALAGVGTTD
ncbi:MAG: shikimate kinase [Gemmatimonadetes bacterium]|nr:shikimate kinase [Gemmatimonadota bacterium]MBI3567636.1 shikimate kinase [Gemmatimonadota bacterium]